MALAGFGEVDSFVIAGVRKAREPRDPPRPGPSSRRYSASHTVSS
jgi:hypothetical protein